MKKKLIALSAAVLMTMCVAGAMLAIGGAALFNKSGADAANSASQSPKVAEVSASQNAQIQQMQDLITQYQAHEQQYQQREQQYQDQLNQANAQITQFQQQLQQVQALLQALAARGLIVITNDGRIMLNQ